MEGTVGDGIREVEARPMALPSVRDAHFRAVHGAHLPIARDLPTAPGALDLLHEDPRQVETDHAAIREMERDGLWRLAVG